jgi:hypothetical protein
MTFKAWTLGLGGRHFSLGLRGCAGMGRTSPAAFPGADGRAQPSAACVEFNRQAPGVRSLSGSPSSEVGIVDFVNKSSYGQEGWEPPLRIF